MSVDSGVGMTKSALMENLGTIARSGTQEFLEKIEKGGTGGEGANLIGQVRTILHTTEKMVADEMVGDSLDWDSTRVSWSLIA
jgi:HSP90 family molecular chaperone